MNDQGVQVLMFLAQGFEDLEAITIIDVLGWTRVREHLVPVRLTTCAFHDTVTGRFGTTIRVDWNLKKRSPEPASFKAFVLPGGFHCAGFDEAYCAEIHELAKAIHAGGGIIVTMCVGISPVADAGLLRNKRATTYNRSLFHDNVARLEAGGARYTGRKVECEDNIISCAGPASSLEVAYLLVEKVTDRDNAETLKKLMIY